MSNHPCFRKWFLMSIIFRRCVLCTTAVLCFSSVLRLSPGLKAQSESMAPTPKSQQQGFIVPFTPVPGQGAPLITVWINSQVEATFVVDTGTTNDLISQSLVKKLGLVSHPALLPSGKPLLLEGRQPQAVTLTSLKIGGKSGPLNIQPFNGPVCILPDQQLRVSADRSVDGLIGSGLLAKFAVSLNFSAHTMMLVYPGNMTRAEAGYLGYCLPGGTNLPLTINAEDVCSVKVGLENKGVSQQVDLPLDTGSQVTTLPARTAQDLSLGSLGRIPQADHSSGVFTVCKTRPDALVLGEVRLVRPLISYAETADYTPRLGLDILSGYKVLMDFPAKKMYLQPIIPAVSVGPAEKMPEKVTP